MALNKTKHVRVTADLPIPLFEELDKFVAREEVPKTVFIKAALREKLRRERRRAKRA